MSDTRKIVCRPNGPYLIAGPLEIVDVNGQVISIEAGRTTALCRCGAAANKPFCDGAHNRIGFSAAEPSAPQSK